jgi:protocatechuate 3,4-dioxygenase beta subunit
MKNTLPPLPPLSERSRRAFLRAGIALPAVLAAARSLQPTPACADPDDATPSVGEGPFFRPSSPERTSFREPGLGGTPFELRGRVLTTDGRPVPRAIVDFWHTDDSGSYDDQGHRFRGHQRTDAEGRYVLTTIVPGAYGGMAKHYHVKLAGGGHALTTRLQFPEDAKAFRIDQRLVIAVAPDAATGRFDFVLG